MNKHASEENQRTLEALLNLKAEEATEVLDAFVLFTDSGNHPDLVKSLTLLLQKTLKSVDPQPVPGRQYASEVIVGRSMPRTRGPYVFIGSGTGGSVCISRLAAQAEFAEELNGFIFFLTSCYAAGAVLKSMVGDSLAVPTDAEIHLDIPRLIGDPSTFTKKIDLGDCYLAGAGAIGNAFLYALQYFHISGDLCIADPDTVSGGNLNRCLFFTDDDIDEKKVDALVTRAQPLFPELRLRAFPDVIKKLPEAETVGPWLPRLIVAVDSRRARRHLQSEVPREVFDASTSVISEVVLHHNHQPLDGKACMACIYYRDEVEQAHERHLAEALGVTLDQVTLLFVDDEAEQAIKRKYPHLTERLVGLSYDTLFKQLCGQGKLTTEGETRVLAPLAFVSALAGAILALTLARHLSGVPTCNHWRLSPWSNPNFRLQKDPGTSGNCELCNDAIFSTIAAGLWR